ncbi:acyl-CoA thioesterase [Heyndrickxia acidicola]|uniref:Thioesterase family protein n=1 Tax=Heyndrickxia acidicola TaxID=209389 RepID=A0ABU6MJJ6_9BACI|nr:thioesterase family protein [Heyndrickxia acidicola]MED1204841.1 thioesterase family protein [Heyndrickxia acidicola]
MRNISYIHNFQEWKNEFSFFHPVKVRFSETDMFGHLNNTVPFAYFEEARIEFLKKKQFMQDWVRKDHEAIPVVADLQCDYIKQVFFDELLQVYVKVEKVGSSSCDIHYMAVDTKGEVCFVGRGAMVQMSMGTGKGIAFTDEEKQRLLSSSVMMEV